MPAGPTIEPLVGWGVSLAGTVAVTPADSWAKSRRPGGFGPGGGDVAEIGVPDARLSRQTVPQALSGSRRDGTDIRRLTAT